jgi:hypothetical protein
MDLDLVIDNLLNQTIKDAFRPLPKSAFKQSIPVQNIPIQDDLSNSDSQVTPNNASSVDYTEVSQQPTRRLSREEREKQAIEEYQNQKDNANKDLLLKGLLGAGVVAGIGLLGRNSIKRGTELARQYTDTVEKTVNRQGKEYFKTPPSVFDPRFWTASLSDNTLKQEHQARLKEIYSNPLKLAGAAAYRLGIDGATDASRVYGWRWNHPLQIIGEGVKKTIDPLDSLGAANRYGVAFATTMPALAIGGLAYDIANPSELFRPAGFKQPNPDPENPKESTEPALDLFQRFALGRSGRPLKYSEAKEDIPDLNIDRYKKYLNFTYQDKGPLGLGLIKYTDENLHGQPELRMLGYPVNIPTITTAALGALGARLATTHMENQYRSDMSQKVKNLMNVKPARGSTISYQEPVQPDGSGGSRKVVKSEADLPNIMDPKVITDYVGAKPNVVRRNQLIGALGGAAAGVIGGAFLGTYINNMIASNRNNPETLPTTEEYGIS